MDLGVDLGGDQVLERGAAALLAAGANPDLACKDGTTPREWARRESNQVVLARMR